MQHSSSGIGSTSFHHHKHWPNIDPAIGEHTLCGEEVTIVSFTTHSLIVFFHDRRILIVCVLNTAGCCHSGIV